MREHDVDGESPAAVSRRAGEHDQEGVSGREVGRGIEAGRPDALGPQALLRLQAVAGNSGVSALVAQRSAEHNHGGTDTDTDTEDTARSPVTDVVAGAGRPLAPEVRSVMEQGIGHDFGDVRVHDDASAAASARSVQAQAYTVGNHVVFDEGRYRPETSEGQRTLAHELTHVVQQREGPVDGTPAPGGIQVSDPGDRFERQAENVADRVMSGGGGGVAAPGPSVVQRQVADEEEVAPPPEAAAAERPAAEQVEDDESPTA
jgi:hypothetical protein